MKCKDCGKENLAEIHTCSPQVRQEPVAWMVDGVLFTSLGVALNISFDIEQPCIPLYTAPRELSDEQILKICLDGGYVDCIADVDLEVDGLEELKHQYLRLCRAILKKASEK